MLLLAASSKRSLPLTSGKSSLEKGEEEYRDPVQFFRRTYLTTGLDLLLTNALPQAWPDQVETR